MALLFWAPKSQQMVIAAMKLKDTYFLEGKLQKLVMKGQGVIFYFFDTTEIQAMIMQVTVIKVKPFS